MQTDNSGEHLLVVGRRTITNDGVGRPRVRAHTVEEWSNSDNCNKTGAILQPWVAARQAMEQ